MKKTLLATATLSLLLTSGAAFAQHDQSKGSIQFNGTVTTAACTVLPVAAVDLGSVSDKHFEVAGAKGGWGSTVIKFESCNVKTADNEDGIEGISLKVQKGAADTDVNGLWANVTGDATKVGVRIKVENTEISPDGTTAAIEKNEFSADGQLTYNVTAQMESTGAATPGSVETTLNFIADYK